MTAEELGQAVGCALLCLCPLAILIAIAVFARGRGGSSSSAASSAPAAPASSWTPPAAPQRQRCSCNYGKVPCTCPNGYVYDSNNQPTVHHACGGSGHIRCLMCDGSGYR